jgi:hypothetical protein
LSSRIWSKPTNTDHRQTKDPTSPAQLFAPLQAGMKFDPGRKRFCGASCLYALQNLAGKAGFP